MAKAYMESISGKRLIPFKEWFEPYNLQHIEWARQYLTDPTFDWEKVIPENPAFEVCPLGSCYGIREHILNAFATCWWMLKLEGFDKVVQTH